MKKLLYVTHRVDGIGGLQRVFSIKTNYLHENYNYDVVIVTTNAKTPQPFFDFSKHKLLNEHLKGWGPFYLSNYIKKVNSTIRNEKPDVVIITDNGLKGFLLPFFLRNSGVKIVFEQHGFRFYEAIEKKLSFFEKLKISVKNKVIDYTTSFVDEFVVLTQASKLEWQVKSCQVIPNPLWIENVPENSLKNKNVIFVGRQEFVKGIDLLLPIWKKVIQKHSDWKLHIYSDHNPELKLNNLVQQLNLEQNIAFHGPTLSIEKAYSNASIYLMTSRHEGFGMVLIEAMACGLPCIAFDCPTGPAELITNNSNGYLVKPFDLDVYTEKVITLIENHELRLKLGNNAQKSVEKYKLATVMEQWHQLFSSL